MRGDMNWTKPITRRWLLGLLSLILAWYALQNMTWDPVWRLMRGISLPAILIITAFNLLMLPLMAARWWLLLKTLGAPISLLTACGYRMAAGTVSYLTPGPLFGGEPLAIYLLCRRQTIPLPTATTSVVVDRLLELLASFIVLLFCLSALSVSDGEILPGSQGLVLLIALVALLTGLTAAIFTGIRPLSRFLVLVNALFRNSLPTRVGRIKSLAGGIAKGEDLAQSLMRDHRVPFLLANLLSLGQWAAIFGEFWLMSFFLGFPLSFGQLAAIVVVARLAFFTPLPAGIGVLETALPWMTAMLGLGSALGMGLCLIIRLRDVVVNVAGLGLTWKYLTHQKNIVSAEGITAWSRELPLIRLPRQKENE